MTTATLASFADAQGADGAVRLVHDSGHVERHEVTRWLRDADAVDRRALARCGGPTIDIGCGPGRLTCELAPFPALGIDVCRQAVALTQARGACAIHRDVFDRVPGEGRWHWALLADGNVGIGGDPQRLLRRVAELVLPGGGAVVEVSRHDVDHRGTARIQGRDGVLGAAFPWAVVGARAVRGIAGAAGWAVSAQWDGGDRRFVVLTRA